MSSALTKRLFFRCQVNGIKLVELHRSDESVDGIFGNKVRVIQSRKGYRVSEDAIILTWFARPNACDRVMDAGTGCGVIAFGMAIRDPSVAVVGVEIQKDLADRAARGVKLNDLGTRVLIVRGDVTTSHLFFRHKSFDFIVCNPPYYEPGRGRINPQHERALCRHQLSLPIPQLFSVGQVLLRDLGRLDFIYPTAGIEGIFNAVAETGFQISRMLWIHPHEEAPPGHVCLELVLTESIEQTVEGHLYLYDRQRQRTSHARAILGGECCPEEGQCRSELDGKTGGYFGRIREN